MSTGQQQITFYIDGSWDAGSQMGASAWVATRTTEMARHMQSRRIAAASALQTEIYACHMALAWATTKGLHSILILTDSTTLIQLLNSTVNKDISVLHLLREIKEMGDTFGWCRIMKVHRHDVTMAHDSVTSCRTSGLHFDCL